MQAQLLAWQDAFHRNLPRQRRITKRTLGLIGRLPRLFRGGARLHMGRIWTDSAYEKRRRRVLSTRLP